MLDYVISQLDDLLRKCSDRSLIETADVVDSLLDMRNNMLTINEISDKEIT